MNVDNLGSDMKAGSKAAFDFHECVGMPVFDDQSGEPLDPILVRKARLEEMGCFKSMQVYLKVRVSGAVEATGRKPIAVRWVDMNKGESANLNYRSGFVANELSWER